jgi:hypothetical protein
VRRPAHHRAALQSLRRKVRNLKNCKLCKYSKVCNDLPGICILLPYVAIAVVVVALGYLFITQEIL